MIREALDLLAEGRDLDRETMARVMDIVMSGEATPAQIGALLMGLRAKGETVEEIAGAAMVMRDKAKKIEAPGPCLDTCGTGGDHSGTFNISTASAFVAAAAGLSVAKHGNRSASSKCGSADVLAELGVNIEADAPLVEKCLRDVGIGFLFAPALHGAMRHAIGPRKEMAIRTIFNVLGPLTNPAGAKRQLMGVFAPDLTEKLALVLCELGSEAVMVVHGKDGLDEISLAAPTTVAELRDGEVRTYEITPEEMGLKTCKPEALKGGDSKKNAAMVREVLAGKTSPALDAVALNAGAAIYIGGAVGSIGEGVEKARALLAGGSAMKKLEALCEASRG